MDFVAELVISLLVVIGAIFILVGSIALAKLPDAMQRLHGPTKATTLGVGAVLIASMGHHLVFKGMLSFHELLITLFLLITAPISAHLLAKAYLNGSKPEQK